MAEQFGIELVIGDKIAAQTKRATEQLTKFEQHTKKAQQGLDKNAAAFARMWERVGMAAETKSIRAAERQRRAFSDAWSKIGIAAQKASDKAVAAQEKASAKTLALKKKSSFFGGFREALPFRSIADYASGAFIGGLAANAVTGVVTGFVSGAMRAVSIISDGVRHAFGEASKKETLNLGARLTLGKGGGKDFLEDVSRFSKRTGFDDDTIAAMLLPQRRVFGQKAARSNFAIAGDLAAQSGRGGDQAFVAGILDTLLDVRLKGGIGEKRLVSMGIDTKDFYGRLAKQLGTSPEAAEKRATAGKVDPQLLINTIGDAVEKTQGGILGTGAVAFSKTMEARLMKMKNLPNEYLKAVVDSPEWTRLSDRFAGILSSLDPESPRGKRIVGTLIETFGRVGDAIEKAIRPENVELFVAGIQKAIGAAGTLIESLNDVINLLTGETLSKTLFKGDASDQKIRSLVYMRREAEAMIPGEDRERALRIIAKRESELSPSERDDFAREGGRPMSRAAPRALVAGNAVNQVNVGGVVVQGGGGNRATARKAGDAVESKVLASLERAAESSP